MSRSGTLRLVWIPVQISGRSEFGARRPALLGNFVGNAGRFVFSTRHVGLQEASASVPLGAAGIFLSI
jgi:hypothetical protein